MAGFTLSFGSMFSKTRRVHSIFTNVQLNKKVHTLISHFDCCTDNSVLAMDIKTKQNIIMVMILMMIIR